MLQKYIKYLGKEKDIELLKTSFRESNFYQLIHQLTNYNTMLTIEVLPKVMRDPEKKKSQGN